MSMRLIVALALLAGMLLGSLFPTRTDAASQIRNRFQLYGRWNVPDLGVVQTVKDTGGDACFLIVNGQPTLATELTCFPAPHQR